MKFFRYFASVFSIFISSYTSAHVVTDIREFAHVNEAHSHGYATDIDWVKNIGDFHGDDILPIAITIYDLTGIWLGPVTLALETTSSPKAATESAPFSLITIGCLALAFARYRNS
ncbi:hypothetical protein [Cellvibrio mixtus]|uniref:hypothetical protein n=1 Tax=Cellvibrio mixtus TaxID=39650 RepID=UPI000587E145|nr:hypothetical protein [Cellvibrio mixtus]